MFDEIIDNFRHVHTIRERGNGGILFHSIRFRDLKENLDPAKKWGWHVLLRFTVYLFIYRLATNGEKISPLQPAHLAMDAKFLSTVDTAHSSRSFFIHVKL